MQLGVLMIMAIRSIFFLSGHVAAQGTNSVRNPTVKITDVRIIARYLTMHVHQRWSPVHGCCFTNVNIFHGTVSGVVIHI